MRREFLIATFVFLCVFAISSAQALVGAEGTNFSSNGYVTTISKYYPETMTLTYVEGGGGGSGHWLNSLLTIKIYDNTTSLPYIELYDDDVLMDTIHIIEKGVARIWVNNTNNETEQLIIVTDMRGSKSVWINIVDYTCTGNEDIRKFWVYKEGAGFPDALIFTWLEDCEQMIMPLYVDSFPI